MTAPLRSQPGSVGRVPCPTEDDPLGACGQIRCQASVCALAICVCLFVAPAWGAGEAPACLPNDVRISFSQPEQLGGAVKAVNMAPGRAGKIKVIARLFAEAGCPYITEEPTGEGRESNLVCRFPGKRPSTVVVGLSPDFDGWPAAALLTSLARNMLAVKREHSYAFVVFSRVKETDPSGARVFAEALGEQDPPSLFVHVGARGRGELVIGPNTDEKQRCVLESTGYALGREIKTLKDWDGFTFGWVSSPLQVASLVGEAGDEVRLPEQRREIFPYSGFLDATEFSRLSIPVSGVYDVSHYAEPLFKPESYVRAYQLLAAYLLVVDQLSSSDLPVTEHLPTSAESPSPLAPNPAEGSGRPETQETVSSLLVTSAPGTVVKDVPSETPEAVASAPAGPSRGGSPVASDLPVVLEDEGAPSGPTARAVSQDEPSLRPTAIESPPSPAATEPIGGGAQRRLRRFKEALVDLVTTETTTQTLPPAAAPSGSAAPLEARFHLLKELLDQGLITNDDYEAKKKELLDSL